MCVLHWYYYIKQDQNPHTYMCKYIYQQEDVKKKIDNNFFKTKDRIGRRLTMIFIVKHPGKQKCTSKLR